MMSRRRFIGTTGAAIVGSVARADASALDTAIDAAINDKRIVGCVVLVNEKGRNVYARAAGHADRETGRKMNLDTPFRLASLTKPFTTMAALKLIEAGHLASDDPVSKWLPAFTPRMADGTVREITVGHLMGHMAGLDYGFQQPNDGAYARLGVSDGLDGSKVTLEENITRIAQVPLDLSPGERWRYSVATDVLGAVIEGVTALSLPQAIKHLVTAPLQLNAAFDWQADDLAIPYSNAQPEPVRMSGSTAIPLPLPGAGLVRFDPDRIRNAAAFPSGGAGMAGRASDVMRLLEAYRGGDFLSDDLRAAARKPRIGEEAMAQGPGWGFSWLGAVLVVPEATGATLSPGSVSWGGVYGSWWAIDFERDRVIVALTNTAFEGMIGKFAQDVARA